MGLPAGDCTVFVSRGFEWSVSRHEIQLSAGGTGRISAALRREVPTPGLVSCDTHVHTLTHSGHGDATIDERMLTIAGEGLELPVATDHNIHADYSEPARRLGMSRWFTPIMGNEVTTPTGHFNIFPVEPGARVPDHKLTDWPALMAELRATPGVRVVVLNHPRNIHNKFQPFAAANFNRVSGENKRGPEFTFDVIELLSSSAQQSDPMLVNRDWFALLNHGYRIPGVGSSDCHDVSRYIVGQSRTFIVCPDGDPGRIDVPAACSSLLAGRALVSLGLLTRMIVAEKFDVGDLATGLGEQVKIDIAILGPSWVRATRIALFANGVKIREETLPEIPAAAGSPSRGGKARLAWTIRRPAHDVHLVAMATGPGVTEPFWMIPRPYQPTSTRWTSQVIGITNPTWLDADGDGKFTPARAYARRVIDQAGTAPAGLLRALDGFDEAVAAQAASLCAAAGVPINDSDWTAALESASESTRRGFAAFAAAND